MNLRLIGLACLAATVTVGALPEPPDPTESALWHTAAAARGVPAVLGDRAFATTLDHEVVALSVSNGDELWRSSTGERGRFTEGTRVVATDDAVIVGDYDVYAFHPRTGEALWQFHPSEGYAPGVFVGDTAGGRVYTGSGSGHVYALDATTGRLMWTAFTERGPSTTSVYAPVSDGNVVVVVYTVFSAPTAGGAVALDAATGRERWRFRFPQSAEFPSGIGSSGGPVIGRGLAFVSSEDAVVWALDLDTGAVKWKIPPLAGPITGIITKTVPDSRSLAAVGQRLIVGSTTGYVVAYDIGTQQETWRFEGGWMGSHGFEDFTSWDGVVYVSYFSGFLLAIDAERGDILWQTRDYKRGLAWPPTPAGDRVIAAGLSGFWALPAKAPPPSPQRQGEVFP